MPTGRPSKSTRLRRELAEKQREEEERRKNMENLDMISRFSVLDLVFIRPCILPDLSQGIEIQREIWQLEASVKDELLRGIITRWVIVAFRLSTESTRVYLQESPKVLYWALRRWAYYRFVLRCIPAIIRQQDDDFRVHSGQNFVAYRNFRNQLD